MTTKTKAAPKTEAAQKPTKRTNKGAVNVSKGVAIPDEVKEGRFLIIDENAGIMWRVEAVQVMTTPRNKKTLNLFRALGYRVLRIRSWG